MQKVTKDLRHIKKTIGQNIHNERLRRKMTLKKLSRLTGISTDRLDQFELGKNCIQLEDLIRITSMLKL